MGEIFGIPWDDSKGFWDNVGGGIADNTVEKLPAWDSSKGVTENISGGVQDGINSAVKAVQDVAGGTFSTLKKYWYVPVIIGGMFIGYKLLTGNPNAQMIRAINKLRLPE